MIVLGTIKGTEIRKNRDSKAPVRMLSAEISSPKDVQSVELVIPSGEDFSPEDDDIVIVLKISEAYKIGISSDDGIEPDETLDRGEKEIYAKSQGSRKAKIRLKLNDEIVMNDGADYAVLFDVLKAEIDKLKIYINTHVHKDVTPGAGSSGVPLVLSDLDISLAKAEKIRI